MGKFVVRALLALVAALFVTSARDARADPNCDSGKPDGFRVLAEHSSPDVPRSNPSSFVCNLMKGGIAGLAVTIDYACAAETEAAWQSKTASRTKNVVSKSSTEVLVREIRSGRGYAGDFEATEKLFIRVDARTIATVYVTSFPKEDGGGLIFGAEQAAGYARNRATANAPFSSNWKCPEGVDMPPVGTSTSTGQPPPSTGSGPGPGPLPGPGPTATSAPAGDKKAKKATEKEPENAPILGLSLPVLVAIVTAVVLAGAGFTWVIRRPRRAG